MYLVFLYIYAWMYECIMLSRNIIYQIELTSLVYNETNDQIKTNERNIKMVYQYINININYSYYKV